MQMAKAGKLCCEVLRVGEHVNKARKWHIPGAL